MATTGLVKNTDFPSDLILNKVMNGQYSATSGKTITLAGRVNAAKLDAQATAYGVEAENARQGAVYGDAVANALSEIADIAKRASQANVSMDSAELKSYATGLYTELEALLKTKAADGSTALFGGTGPTFDLGQGSGTVTLGQASSAGGIAALTKAFSSLTAGTNLTDGSIEEAQGLLLADVSTASAKAALFENRYNSLNDLISSYQSASTDQVVNAGGNSTSLLNNLIG